MAKHLHFLVNVGCWPIALCPPICLEVCTLIECVRVLGVCGAEGRVNKNPV